MLAGLLGVGGGVLLVPFLVLAVGMTQHEAEATSLLVILPTALAASVALRRRHVGDLPIALAVGLVGAVGAVAGVLLALALDADVLRLVFAALLAFVGVRLIARRPRGSMSATRSADSVSTVERLALAIQSQVLSGEVPVGTRLRQEALAEEFGVSRTPVREALRQLQATACSRCNPTEERWSVGPRRERSARPTRCAPSSRVSRPSSPQSGSATATSFAYARPKRCFGSRSRR